LAKYNQECENASMQTQKTENMLKEKETQRQHVQKEKQDLEKKLSQLSEKNLKEQSINYQLSYKHKYFTQKSAQAEKRIAMLQDKLKYMTTTLTKQIKEQAERATEIEIESKKLKMEIVRQKDEVAVKQSELKKLQDSNEAIKKAGYDRKMEELNRQLYNLEKERTEFQMKLESTHVSWTCKLQLFVTDMNTQSEKTQKDLQQINDLLSSMTAVSEKQAGLLQQR
jgi:chromosome segregation ATPase